MLASSSDEEAVLLDSDAESEKDQVGSTRKKEANGRTTTGSNAANRSALLSMKLSETETSEDEKKYR